MFMFLETIKVDFEDAMKINKISTNVPEIVSCYWDTISTKYDNDLVLDFDKIFEENPIFLYYIAQYNNQNENSFLNISLSEPIAINEINQTIWRYIPFIFENIKIMYNKKSGVICSFLVLNINKKVYLSKYNKFYSLYIKYTIKNKEFYLDNPIVSSSIIYKIYNKTPVKNEKTLVYIDSIIDYLKYNTQKYPDICIIPFSGWRLDEIKKNCLIEKILCKLSYIYIVGICQEDVFISTFIVVRRKCFDNFEPYVLS